MKICEACNSEFEPTGIFHPHQKFCLSADCRKQRSLRRVKTHQQRSKDFVNEIKSKLQCIRCGIKDIRVLDFHHRGDKSEGVSRLIYLNADLETLQREIEKCEVLCANCHRIKHREEEARRALRVIKSVNVWATR